MDAETFWAVRSFALRHEAKQIWQLRNGATIRFWTHENHAVEIYSDKFFFQKSDWSAFRYIHQNPVRAGIVAKAEDYLYSSASNFIDKGGLIDVEYYGRRVIDATKSITY